MLLPKRGLSLNALSIYTARRGVINSNSRRRALLVYCFFTLNLISMQVSAEIFSWGRFSYSLFPAFETPTLACKYALSVYGNAAIHSVQSIPYISIPSHSYIRSCSYYIGSNGPYTDVMIRRNGDSCREQLQYNPTTGVCGLDALKGPPEGKSCIGNSVNFAIGNKFKTETDYSASGNSKLSFARNYNSLDGLWRHSYSAHLRLAGTQNISVVMADGRELFYTANDATITAMSADLGILTKTTTGWQFLSTDNERFTFNTSGKLTQWSSAQGAVHQFAYTGSQITVTDSFGNNLSFTEDADHQPLTLSAPGIQITYGYDANKRLTSVPRTSGGQVIQRQFHYEDSRNTSLLTGITDERGVRYATWVYDDQGRAISSEHADGADYVRVAYNSDDTVTVTNELGKVAKYSFQYIKDVKRITSIQGEPSANCPNSNSTFTYDTRGLLKTKTDNRGYLTDYTYNTRGLEVSRTEASGTALARTITTEWHPTLFLPLTVSEPNRITTYTYDAQGRQLSQAVTPR